MKKIILSLSAALLTIGLHAQKTEMDATISAFKSKNYKEAVQEANKAENLLASNRTIEPKEVALFYLNAGQAAKASGDMTLAAQYFAKLGKLENAPYYKAKNKDTKNWEYFYDRSEADKIVSAGNYTNLKEESESSGHMQSVAAELNKEANVALEKGDAAFQGKNFDLAGKEYLKASYIFDALGNDSNLLKYYASLAILQTDDKAKAAPLLQALIDDEFTGIRTNYFAKDKESGKQVAFANKSDMDTQVKLGLYTDPKVDTTESLEEELYSNSTYAWYSTEDWDKALDVVKKGLKKFPANENMNQLMAGIYFSTGNTTEFIKSLQDKAQKGTASGQDYFNLAKSLEDAGDIDQAVKNYKLAIEKDPDYANAYLNLGYAIIKPEQQYVDIMNDNLGTSANSKKVYSENQEKRKKLHLEALPYLEKAYKLQPDNISLINFMRNSYDVVDNDEQFFKFKKLYEEKARN